MPYHSRKYDLNEDFFSTWSPRMAYVLGFWYADGNMRHDKSYKVRFSSNDFKHLIEVRSLMSSNSPLTWESKGICKTFAVMSKKLYYDLKKNRW